MDPQAVIAIFYIASLSMLWCIIWYFMGRNLYGPPFIYLFTSAYTTILPAGFYVIGFEGLYSSRFSLEMENMLVYQALIISVFAVGLVAGYNLFPKPKIVSAMFPHLGKRQLRVMIVTGVFLLTLGSMFFVFNAFTVAGGILNTIGLIRHGDFYDNVFFLHQFIRLGTLLSMALMIDNILRHRKGENVPAPLLWGAPVMFLINIMAAFFSGGKSYVVYPLFALALAYIVFFKKGSIRSLILPAVLLVSITVTMQYYRVVMVAGNEFDVGQQVAVGAGLSYLDTNLIYLERMTDHVELGEDFYRGAVGIIPRVFWEDKPRLTAGGYFRQTVEPGAQSAWPVMSFNMWYSNFGWLGLLVGGFITGLILKALATRYADYRENPYSFFLMAIFTIVFFIQGGIINLVFNQYFLYVVPLWIFVLLSSRWVAPQESLKLRPGKNA